MTYGRDGLSIFGEAYTEKNILTGVWTPGKVFYVDTAANGGSDDNTGLSVDAPLLKINAAMDKCTASKGDVIQVFHISRDELTRELGNYMEKLRQRPATLEEVFFKLTGRTLGE